MNLKNNRKCNFIDLEYIFSRNIAIYFITNVLFVVFLNINTYSNIHWYLVWIYTVLTSFFGYKFICIYNLQITNVKERLISNEERLALIMDSSADGVWDLNLEKDEMYFSQKYKDILNYGDYKEIDDFRNIDKDDDYCNCEIDRKRLEEIIHPDDYNIFIDKLTDYINKKISKFELEFRINTKDGGYKWISARGNGIYNDKEEIVRIIGIYTDITENKIIEEKLKSSETFYRILYTDNHLIMYVIDAANGDIIDVNESACLFYGYRKERFIKLKITDLNILSYKEVYSYMEKAKLKKVDHFYFKHKLSSGEIKDVEVYSGFVRIEEREFLYSIVYDVTEKKKNEEKLKLFRKLLENNTEGVVIADDKGIIKWVNPAFCSLTGYSEQELIGKNPKILKSGKHDNDFYKNMWESIAKEGKWKGEIWNKRKNGEQYLQSLNMFLIKDNDTNIVHFAGIISDITQCKDKEQKINYLAFRDSLTGLYNRAFFIEKLNWQIKEESKKKEALAVVFMDIDGFKKINDNLGHVVGDKLLQEVAKRLRETIRKNDIVARIGGDEFVILLPKIKGKEYAVEIAQRIIEMFKSSYTINDCDIYISVSIGIALYPEDALDSDTLIKNADIAMYNAKDSGKNIFKLYSSKLNDKIKEEFSLENSLRYALEKNEFFIEYQPIFDISSDKVIGAEALIRWKNEDLGYVEPDKFIPIAEKSNFIIPIGQWVLENACIQAKKWHDKGYKIFIAVNISVNQLKKEGFVEDVSKILKKTYLEPEYLELEITESISVENIYHIIRILNKLKELKVTISMDDFGTGYSSLAQLKNLYISKLKIDKSFTKDIEIDASGTLIVSTIIAMAKSLNLKVVAEGVETNDQLEFLKEYECDMIQGYLIGAPTNSESFEKFLNK